MNTVYRHWLPTWICAGALGVVAHAGAAETVKIGFVDLLSGPLAHAQLAV